MPNMEIRIDLIPANGLVATEAYVITGSSFHDLAKQMHDLFMRLAYMGAELDHGDLLRVICQQETLNVQCKRYSVRQAKSSAAERGYTTERRPNNVVRDTVAGSLSGREQFEARIAARRAEREKRKNSNRD